MKNQNENKPDYGNWVPKKLLYSTSALGLIFIALSFLYLIFIVLALFFFLAFGYFIYARYKISPEGGNLQVKIRDLVLEYLEWDGKGKVLDIGIIYGKK
ncbi:MAG: hypothetical protein ACOC6P_00510 [Candidatus Aminicenantaceae bacterium]